MQSDMNKKEESAITMDMKQNMTTHQPLRLLGVFAHPDDESFCAGGTFANAVAQGAEVMVVSATRGEAGQIRSAGAATRQTLGRVREQELQRACLRLGIQHTNCLDYTDGTLRDVDQELLIEDIVELLRSFRPDVVITFGSDGGYGHPDHIAISAATTAACLRSGDNHQFPEQIAAGLVPHRPEKLYHSHFPHRPQLLLDQLVKWLVPAEKRFQGNLDFVYALLLLCEESSLLHYSRDHFEVSWYPTGFSIIEQGEAADSLYLILSGSVNVIREAADGAKQILARLGPGSFFGEEGLAYQRPRNAHVVAAESVTCLVLSPEAPTAFLGRGEDAHLTDAMKVAEQDEHQIMADTTCIEVGPFLQHKIEAIMAHRTQFPMQPHMLPQTILRALMGQEYFVPVSIATSFEPEFLVLQTV
jgi:LmbE family N-acetylglucosaminyl deacetylase